MKRKSPQKRLRSISESLQLFVPIGFVTVVVCATMPVSNINQFKGHIGGTFHRILIPAGRTEATVTAEGNEFEFSAFGAAVHGTTIRRVTTINHLLDVFNHSVARMKSIYHFFIMIGKDFLENIHMIIME